MRIPFISFLILLIVSVLIDWVIYRDLKRVAKPVWLPRAYFWSAVVCWVYLIVVYLLPKRDVEDGILHLMWMLFAYTSIYFGKTVIALFSMIGHIPCLFKRKSYPLGLWFGLPLGILAFGSMWYGVAVTRHKIEVIPVTIWSDHLPSAFDGYKIVQFSDLHTGTWGEDTTFVSKLVDTINAQKPDIIFFTGDIVNRKTTELRPFLPVLNRLKAPDGIYSILGNHDYGDYIEWPNPHLKLANNRLLDKWEREMGWRLLNNSHTFITKDRTTGALVETDSIVLIGTENWGEPPFKQYGDLTKAYPRHPDSLFNLNDSRFKILLTHNPEHWRKVVSAQTNIDLTLSGHTHAMQIQIKNGSFKWSPSQYVYKLWGGLYKSMNLAGKEVNLYVNIGSGEVGMPFRIGATPEITVITLKRGSDNGESRL